MDLSQQQYNLPHSMAYYTEMFSSAVFPLARDKVDVTGVRARARQEVGSQYFVLQEYQWGDALYQKCVIRDSEDEPCLFQPMRVDGYEAVTVALSVDQAQLDRDVVMLALTAGASMTTRDKSVSLRVRNDTVFTIVDRRVSDVVLFFLRYDVDPLLPFLEQLSTTTVMLGPMPASVTCDDVCVGEAISDGYVVYRPEEGKDRGVCNVAVEEGKRNTILFTTFAVDAIVVGRLRLMPISVACHLRLMASGKSAVPILVEFADRKELTILSLRGYHPTEDRVATDAAAAVVAQFHELAQQEDEESSDEDVEEYAGKSDCDSMCGCLDHDREPMGHEDLTQLADGLFGGRGSAMAAFFAAMDAEEAEDNARANARND